MENKFIDEAVIEVASGGGGDGAVHFRREKFVPKGGPDGGDGGDGGDVVFTVRRNLKTLAHLKMRPVFRAENGRPGAGQRKHGRRGADVEIPVPPGTLIRDSDSGRLIRDLVQEGESWRAIAGGRGGRGNARFATSTRQTPRFAEEGRPGSSRRLLVELSLIADVGLLGQPNAGKSTLLGRLSNAHPKTGAYPFTTRSPNLGMLRIQGRDILVADIPGIIQGASHGAGLGLEFLRHVRRTRLLLFLIDLGDPDPVRVYGMLLEELRAFDEEMTRKPRLVVGNKLDLEGAPEALAELQSALSGQTVLGISALTGEGTQGLVNELLQRFAGPA
ncbi:MAG: GTPase ObgE [Spirochaetales bacterium]|nr:GTPase ObgE [Spirochaetales bacterium]